MDPFKLLIFNSNGIFETVRKYSNKGNIKNIIDQLEDGLKNYDLEKIQYFLQELVNWYDNNLNKINQNEFVHNFDDHQKNRDFLKEINPQIQEMKELELRQPLNDNENSEEAPILFLSHRSTDSDYGDILRSFFLSIGLKDRQIVYTSHPRNKIPFGENIYNYLRTKISNKTYILFLFSEEYLASVACLNEMGAAWIARSRNGNLFLPNFDFNNVIFKNCCIDDKSIGITLNADLHCKQGLRELANNLTKMFNLSLDEEDLSFSLDETCEKLREINEKRALSANGKEKNGLVADDSFTSAVVTDIRERGKYRFLKLDRLLQTGETVKDGETHWIQSDVNITEEIADIKEGDKIQFKVKAVKPLVEKGYGLTNFRNVYVEYLSKQVD